jgi:hypothetical protein
VLILLLTAAIFLLGERAALAYVDPGTGSLLYQTALTIVLGLGLVFRRVRGSIVGFVKRLGGHHPDSDGANAPD